MGITQEILSASIEAAEREHAVRINEIRISVGDLTEVVETALQFAFEVLRQDTIAADATLVVNQVPPKSLCRECENEFTHDKWDLTCPRCGGFLCEILEGRELRVDSLDIDTADGNEELS